MEKLLEEILNIIKNKELIKITFSNNRNKNLELEKVIGNLVIIKNSLYIQLEYKYSRILKHKNINIKENSLLIDNINVLLLNFKDINIQSTNQTVNIKISKKYKVSINKKKETKNLIIEKQNKKKTYFLDENKKYEFLVELGSELPIV